MHKIRRNLLEQALMALDSLAVVVALAACAASGVGHEQPAGRAILLPGRTGAEAILLASVLVLACRRIFSHCGLYRSRRAKSKRSLYGEIAGGMLAAAGMLGAAMVALKVAWVTPRGIVVFWSVGTAAIASCRVALYRALEEFRARGYNLRHVLVIGAGPRGQRFAKELESHPELGYRVAGFLDDEATSRAALPDARSLGDLPVLLRAGRVDEVAIALPIKSYYTEMAEVIAICQRFGVVVRLPGDLFEANQSTVDAEQFEELGVLTLCQVHGSQARLVIKRALDACLAAAALICLAPLLLAIGLAIEIDSRGPVLFRQLRVGRNGRRFRMLKFRTMCADAELQQAALERWNEADGAAFKMRADPRVTRVGRWLRRTSLDELPQLANVLKGEMSLVGPRPLPVRDADRIREDGYRRRFSVRPGLTCLWQAGGRHRIGFDEWMRLDLQYIDQWSLTLDLKILLRTLPAVWSGAGAS